MNQTEFKLRSISTPAVDKLDPSINFNKQLSKAAKDLYQDGEAEDFKNCQESLNKAKKDKMSSVRDAQKAIAHKMQQEELEKNALKSLEKPF